MATPMTADQQISMLKKWGIPYKEYKNWRTNNRNHKGTWGPVNGFMVHHTGSDSLDQRELLYSGHSALPGPLSQWGLDQQGVIHLIGNGRCNHAGLGDLDVFNAVRAESYVSRPPIPNQTNKDGNPHFYGLEIWYDGSHVMTTKQRATLVRLGAGIIDFHEKDSWTEKSIIAHGEWQPGKWDPGYKSGKLMDMPALRVEIKNEKLEKEEVPPVTTKPETKTKTYNDVWHIDAATPPEGHATKTNPFWVPMSILRGAYEMAELAMKYALEAKKNTDEILKILKAK